MAASRVSIKKPIQKSKRLINIKEFLIGKNLRIEEIAGFKAYVNYEKYMSDENWNIKLKEYLNK